MHRPATTGARMYRWAASHTSTGSRCQEGQADSAGAMCDGVARCATHAFTGARPTACMCRWTTTGLRARDRAPADPRLRAVGTAGMLHLGDILDEAEEDVGVERALVRLVDDHHAVLLQSRLGEELAQQHAVRHVLHDRLVARVVLEADGVPDLAAEPYVHLLRDPRRDAHRRDAPRLRAPDHACMPPAHSGGALGQHPRNEQPLDGVLSPRE